MTEMTVRRLLSCMPIDNPYSKDGSRNLSWTQDQFHRNLAEAEALIAKRGVFGKYTVFVSTDWVDVGVKPQHIKSFFFKKVVLSKYLPKGTMVACEMSPRTISLFCNPDISLVQSYPKAGTACKEFDARLVVYCSILPIINNAFGILHLSTTDFKT